jgi:hypothetical protein
VPPFFEAAADSPPLFHRTIANGDVPPRHRVAEAVCQGDSFCRDESACSGAVLSPDGVHFPGESVCSKEGHSRDGARFPGESVFPGEGHSQGVAHSPSQTHSVDEAPRDVVLECYAARFQAGEGCSPVCSRGVERGCWGVMELRDSQEPCTVPRRGWPLRLRAR